MNCYPFIEAEKQGDHNVKRACELLQVSRSAYYADCASGPSVREQRDAELTGKIIENPRRVQPHLRLAASPPRAPIPRRAVLPQAGRPADAGRRPARPHPATMEEDHDP